MLDWRRTLCVEVVARGGFGDVLGRVKLDGGVAERITIVGTLPLKSEGSPGNSKPYRFEANLRQANASLPKSENLIDFLAHMLATRRLQVSHRRFHVGVKIVTQTW